MVPIPGFEELSPEFRARSERAGAARGPGNSLHAFAPSEDLGGAVRDFLEAAMNRGSLTRLLIRMAVSSGNQCHHRMAHQQCHLAGLGVADGKIAAVSAPDNRELSPRERAAIRFAQALTIDPGAITDNVYADFTREFTPQERIEVAIVAAAMGMLNP